MTVIEIDLVRYLVAVAIFWTLWATEEGAEVRKQESCS